LKSNPPHTLAENPRTARKAAIKRASARARAGMSRFDAQTLGDLTRIYRQAVADLQGQVNGYASSDGTVRLEVLQDLLAQANARLSQLEAARNSLLNQGLDQAAQIGIEPWIPHAGEMAASLTNIADDAVRFVNHFVGEDGLQLSDRIWRIDNNARRVVSEAIQSAVIQGHSASKAAQEFLSRGVAVPRDVADKLSAAGAQGIGKNLADGLLRTEGNPYDAALRVFRTELNRAHGEAYQAAAFAHPDTIGTRFLLSPRHPRHDICDLHAHANVYGLGPGVYPEGKNPWPAHPNTLSYVEVVFADEVTPEDKAGKESRLEWIGQQPAAVQASVLGGQKKAGAFRAGILRENEIATPWRVLKDKYEKRGIDPARWKAPPPTPKPPTDNAQAERWAVAFDRTDPAMLEVIARYPAPKAIPPDSDNGAYHIQGGIMMGLQIQPDTSDGRRSWRHEYGHYMDYAARQGGFYASDSADGKAAVEEDDRMWKDRRKATFKAMREAYPDLAEKHGKVFGEDKFKALRREAFQQARADLAGELRAKLETPEVGEALTKAAIDYLDEQMQARDDLWGQAWSLADEAWKQRNVWHYHAAERFEDLSWLAGNIPRAHESHVNISDLVGSITLNKSGSGHEDTYYKQWPHRRAAEAFANCFDLLCYGRGGFEAQILEAFAPAFTTFTKRTLGL
jgi:hypothetical protein